jgi:uncharacterized protein
MAKGLFTADLHGNERQYRKLTEYAITSRADYILIGGDLAPKGLPKDIYIESQRSFLEDNLPRLLYPIKEKNPSARIFLMLGNDDCACNMDVLEKNDGNLYHLIHGKRFSLDDGFELIGYGNVPITPFSIKDWEKFDLSAASGELAQAYLQRKSWNYRFEGLIGRKEGWQRFRFDEKTEKGDSIQRDLESAVFTQNPEKTLYVMHCPPDNTNLDKIMINQQGKLVPLSVGSFAIREFIEKHKPYATLHGHIHESADITGKFKEELGKTTMILAGNYDNRDALSVVEFELGNVKEARRFLL